MIFVDTNLFVRYFLKDVLSQFRQVEKLFSDGAKKKKKLFTSTIVIFEIYWLFGSFYEKTKGEVVEILKKTFSLDFIEFEEREILEKALNIFEVSSLDFEDCYNVVYAEERGAKGFRTFDKKLERYLKKAR